MSRVTLEQIHRDFELASNHQFSVSRDIEVVPRKIVEMIIEKCVEDFCSPRNDGGMAYEATCIKDYAESLLKQFEEDEKWINIPKGLSEELQELELEEREYENN